MTEGFPGIVDLVNVAARDLADYTPSEMFYASAINCSRRVAASSAGSRRQRNGFESTPRLNDLA
jgi:hypothetical protein